MSEKNSEILSSITSEVLDGTKGGSVEVGGYQEIQDLLLQSVLVPFINQGAQGDSIEPIPKGIILHGEQGTGKTLLAKQLAWRISKASNTPVTFYKMYGPEQVSSNMGMSEKNLRNLNGIMNLFEAAIKTQPSVVFIDKIANLCPDGNKLSIQNARFYASVVSTISSGFDKIEAGKILVVASTKEFQSIDPTIRGNGRFNKAIEVRLPNEYDRLEILKIHSKMFYGGNDEILAQVSQRTQGFSGEDLENLCLRVNEIARNKLKTPDEMGMEENTAYFEMISKEDLRITDEDWNLAFGQIYQDKKDNTY